MSRVVSRISPMVIFRSLGIGEILQGSGHSAVPPLLIAKVRPDCWPASKPAHLVDAFAALDVGLPPGSAQ